MRGLGGIVVHCIGHCVALFDVVRHFYGAQIAAPCMGHIWDDPWISVATVRGEAAPWNTTLPPPSPPSLPANLRFRCVTWTILTESEKSAWLALVGTRWRPAIAGQRLDGAWIPLITDSSGSPVATCVLRPRGGEERLWLLETLRAKRGHGSTLMRHLMTWIWQREGPFVLGFTWELTPLALAGAWWRGWLAAAAAIEFGWIWRSDGCSFCPGKPVTVGPARLELPTLLRFGDAWAIVNDSGLCDGVGCVLDWRGDVPWGHIAEAGGWSSLWLRASVAPSPKWRRTGEIVVVGLLNAAAAVAPQRWITAEI